MDGYGINKETKGNAIALEGSPNVNRYRAEYPSSQLGASGMSVGLPEGQMGNSEVGHLNMGAGRIVYQELTKITKEIQDGEFFKNEALLGAIGNAKQKGKKLHIWGLCSDGGVHSHNTHLYALLELCKKEGLSDVFVHCFMDGRDVSPTSGAGFVRALQDEMKKIGCGAVASVCGRYYAMDRDNRWERVVKAYEMLTLGNGIQAEDAAAAIEESYKKDVTGRVHPPHQHRGGRQARGAGGRGRQHYLLQLPPRPRQRDHPRLHRARFQRLRAQDGLPRPVLRLLHPIRRHLLACARRLQAAEPEEHAGRVPRLTGQKAAAHRRNGKNTRTSPSSSTAASRRPIPGEVRVLVPSPKVATYDLKPEMSAYEVTEKVLEQLSTGEYDVMILNFANCDMVGHTGVLEAAEKAVAAVDDCVDKVLQKILSMGGGALLTADHGNADKMIAEDGSPFTAHTTNPVPVVLVCDALKDVKLREGGVLADLAPTLLDMMGIPVPAEMTGKTLIVR